MTKTEFLTRPNRGNSKLTYEKIQRIKSAPRDFQHQQIARVENVSASTVSLIRRGKLHKDIPAYD